MNTQYDQTTGPVFTETQVPVTSMTFSWASKTKGLRVDPRTHRHHRGHGIAGASSLYDMALRSCAWHIDLFLPTDMQAASFYFAEKIYVYLRKNHLLTANVWSMFQEAFRNCRELDPVYELRVASRGEHVPTELPSIQKWLNTRPFSNLSALGLHDFCIGPRDLMALMDTTNLAVLSIRNWGFADPGRTDKAMRDWGRAVQEKGAFTKLKVAILAGFPTNQRSILECLAKFPALNLCALDQTPVTREWVLGPTPPQTTDEIEGVLADSVAPYQVLPRHLLPHYRTYSLYDIPDIGCLLTNDDKMSIWFPPQGEEGPTLPLSDDIKPPAFSVSYNRRGAGYFATERLVWLERVYRSTSKGDTIQPQKRNQDAGDNDTKKRRVRPGKQVDVGSLLGGFS